MEQKLVEKMKGAWVDWHADIAPEDIPSVNPSFQEGYEAAHELLMPLLQMAAPHVYASAGAEHMLDGFKPKKLPIDELVNRIRDVVPNGPATKKVPDFG